MNAVDFARKFNAIREKSQGKMFTTSELIHLFEENGVCISSTHFTAQFRRLFNVSSIPGRKNVYYAFKRSDLDQVDAGAFADRFNALQRRYREHMERNTQAYIQILENRGYRVIEANRGADFDIDRNQGAPAMPHADW